MMDASNEQHERQVAFWNGPGGEMWVGRQDRTEATLAPVADAAIALAAPRAGETVIDIGCGAGATTLALAQAVGPGGHVTGLDVSEPLLEVARRRDAPANVDWVLADASRHAFTLASVDLLFSRFGVMFFGDPANAFANLRGALRPGGRLVFACWRPFDQNPWMGVPLRAVQTLVPALPRPGPEDPGPFSFADRARVDRILTHAGFAAPRYTPFDMAMDIAGGQGVDMAVAQALQVGPARTLLQDQPEDVVAAATAAIRTALLPHVDGGSVRLAGAVWLVDSVPV
jgi:SAM-dependent methyltransferase